MRTPSQRGLVGNWLLGERSERGWTQKVTLANLRRAGIVIAASVYAEYESGTRVPSEKNLARLESFFGPIEKERPGTDATDPGLSELAQAIAEMAAQVKAMIDRVDLDRVEDNSARIRALEAQMASVWSAIHPEPANDGASAERPAPRARGG